MRLTEEEYRNLPINKGKEIELPKTDIAPGFKICIRKGHEVLQKNKTEQRYEDEKLNPLLFTKKIIAYQFEMIKFRLAWKTFYTPDYIVITQQGRMEAHEIKGGRIEDDAIVKFKVAASMFPYIVWKLWQYKQGEWILLLDM